MQQIKLCKDKFLIMMTLIVVMVWSGFRAFNLDFVPSHDFAADMLLSNIIRDEGRLLVGHYSRFGFNHPGPFWFYWNHIMELCLNWLPLTKFQIWTIGSIVINSLLLFFSGRGLSDYLFKKINNKVVLVLTSMLLMVVGDDFITTWMPNRLITTYIAFIVCVLNISRGNLSYLPWATLIGSMLLHGYVTMPVMTLIPLVVSFFVIFLFKKNEITKKEVFLRLKQSSIIAIIFAFPLVIDAFSIDSNIGKIIDVQNGFINSLKPSWNDMLVFYRKLTIEQSNSVPLYCLSALCLFFLFILGRREDLMRLGGIVFFFFLSTAEVIFFYKTTSAPIEPFVATFYIGFPSIIVTSILCLLANRIVLLSLDSDILLSALAVISLLIALAISNRHITPNDYQANTSSIRLFSDFIQKNSSDKKVIVLNYSQHDQWGFIAGLMLELDRRSILSCVTWSHMTFLYTKRMICPSEYNPEYLIVKTTECDGQCILTDNMYGLKSTR